MSEAKDDPGRYTPGEHVVDARVDVLELTLFRDDPGAADHVQREDIGEILAGANDGADDGTRPPSSGTTAAFIVVMTLLLLLYPARLIGHD